MIYKTFLNKYHLVIIKDYNNCFIFKKFNINRYLINQIKKILIFFIIKLLILK
jgi:hypothetical protein